MSFGPTAIAVGSLLLSAIGMIVSFDEEPFEDMAMKLGEIETRLVKLEKVVSQLQTQTSKSSRKRNRWWVTDAGRFADDPVFDEIVELGREYRKSLKPKRRKGQRGDS